MLKIMLTKIPSLAVENGKCSAKFNYLQLLYFLRITSFLGGECVHIKREEKGGGWVYLKL